MLKLKFNSYFGYWRVAIYKIAVKSCETENCLESCENIFGMCLDRDFFPNFLEFSIFDQECLTFCLLTDAKLAAKTKFLGKILGLKFRDNFHYLISSQFELESLFRNEITMWFGTIGRHTNNCHIFLLKFFNRSRETICLCSTPRCWIFWVVIQN